MGDGKKERGIGKEVGERQGIALWRKHPFVAGILLKMEKKKFLRRNPPPGNNLEWGKPLLSQHSAWIFPGTFGSQMVVRGQQGSNFKNNKKKIIIIRGRSPGSCEFLRARRQPGQGGAPCVSLGSTKFPGRRSSAGGMLRGPQAPAGLGRGAATRDSACPIVRAGA